MTVAERLDAQGHKRGRQEGLEQGRQAMAEMVQSMLGQKLGSFGTSLQAAIESADTGDLKRLLEGLLSLETEQEALALLNG